ncbi:MAG: ABC transporter ATP-binding protein [Methanolinea sp.]|nr:ABC transporter ATP-binding protein [Methanolinea sp.]
MLAISGVDLSYGAHLVLSGISLQSPRGTFLGIIGPNGSGKTTLLKAIARLVAPSRGTILLGGKEVGEYPARDLARMVGMVPQATAPGFDFPVQDVVMMGRYPHIGMLGAERPADREAVRRVMEVTGIAHLAERSTREISGGELQRVIIARALAQEPEVLLLDEATAHLDLGHQVAILQVVRDLARRITVIGVFHDLNHAAHFCDRLVLLHDHRILALGEPREVLTGENIERAFGIRAVVREDPLTGRPSISLIPPLPGDVEDSTRVHVVCGGGEGASILSALRSLGFSVTAGVLSVNDSDFVAADTLGIPCIAEPPFSPISDDSKRRLEGLVADADAVIVTRGPWGKGNIGNLEVLSRVDCHRVVLVGFSSWNGQKWDYTDGEAKRIVRSLIESGAREVPDFPSALRIIRTIGGRER